MPRRRRTVHRNCLVIYGLSGGHGGGVNPGDGERYRNVPRYVILPTFFCTGRLGPGSMAVVCSCDSSEHGKIGQIFAGDIWRWLIGCGQKQSQARGPSSRSAIQGRTQIIQKGLDVSSESKYPYSVVQPYPTCSRLDRYRCNVSKSWMSLVEVEDFAAFFEDRDIAE